ncbi:MAG: BON domain-containing protein [Pirellulaceae bacterium]|nr:BON domain-containing protein [Pirellulaceae bacterium]
MRRTLFFVGILLAMSSATTLYGQQQGGSTTTTTTTTNEAGTNLIEDVTRDTGRGTFVGADATDAAGVATLGGESGQQSGGGTSNNRGGGNNNQNRNNRNNQNNRNRQNQNNVIRIKVVTAIVTPPSRIAEAPGRARAIFNEIPTLQSHGGVSITMEGRTAILRGNVASASARDLAKRLVLFEPGIDKVQNEIVVISQDDSNLVNR